ncbi:YgaP-like inner membrane protein [Rickettsiales endosymbiont of Paramecium tredecaurelia]|uniref:rhodanese-like domain-containing protein n=1 Tax=Candidatus Sarmatiella mevalonica TaxID=2770581 RepID=UPI001920BC9A|nr:rhodanese-like domain-containing protein [Candidatus Sarmatiella mevalonica]MBL3284490.1 YgaP-like inner membrane protein [Candidatus Sarmatiella mevalonica]
MKTITASELKKRFDKDEVLLIDVREPTEHKTECIDGACLIPLDEINVERLPSIKRPIVIYCRSGKRSADACIKLLTTSPDLDVASLEGGIIAWSQAGFNVKRSGSNILPLDRQTQIIGGFIAFFGTLLGAMLHPIFYIIPGFVGAGLMFAGVTGWCGMARLLVKMPWNR